MARITPLHLIPALIAAASHAGEITVEKRPFFIEKTFSATALPDDACQLICLTPAIWKEFTLLEIAAHGSRVSAGDLLIRLDAKEIDEKITDLTNSHSASTHTLAQAEQDLALLIRATPDRLAAARRAATIAQEENAYFTATRRKAEEEKAAQNLKISEQILSNQREELKQLTKMYEADDITENTEEIILIRQQDAVAAAEFALRMEMLEHKRTLNVSLPREAKLLEETEREAVLALAKIEDESPRAIELKKIEIQALKTELSREKQNLANLIADRALFEFKAPAAGIFYHGAIENGRWTTGDLIKPLTPQGNPPTHRAFASFIPDKASIQLTAFLDEATQRAIKTGIIGTAILSGREDLEVSVKLLTLAATPGPDGTYRADFSTAWPEGNVPAIGSTAEIRLISYQQLTTITVPNEALRFDAKGWNVEVKLADGKTESRPVKRGRASETETEILAGLEVGQVIVLPEK
jgi:HlyD family secretion protein